MKKAASISLDLDNLWAYMRAHGLPGWREFPTYLPQVAPRIIESMKDMNLKLTVFVVGQDAALEINRPAIQAFVGAGHGVGNHSYLHEPWMHQYSQEELITEIDKAHEAIAQAAGVQPVGFRGPGFSVSDQLLDELCQRGYKYDASIFPTFIGPLARAAYFKTADLTVAERKERKKQFGSFLDGFKPIKPFFWVCSTGTLLEIPVTTIPILRSPIHLTYVHFLAKYSTFLARTYFLFALQSCRLFRVAPSLLLHPLDFLAADEVPALERFPGFGTDSQSKRELTHWCIEKFSEMFDVKSLNDYAEMLIQESTGQGRKLKTVAIS